MDSLQGEWFPHVTFRNNEKLCAASVHGRNVRLEILSDIHEQEENILTHDTAVVSLSFSLDGRFLASFGLDYVTVWDTTTGTQVATWRGHGLVNNVAFSHDNRLLSIITDDSQVVVWNRTDDSSCVLPSPLTSGIYAVAFGLHGKHLAAAGFDRIACLWDLETSSVAAEFPLPASSFALSFSPDGRLLAVGSSDIRLFDVASEELLLTFGAIANSRFQYEFLAFSPDGKCLAAVHDSAEGSILKIWDTTSDTTSTPRWWKTQAAAGSAGN